LVTLMVAMVVTLGAGLMPHLGAVLYLQGLVDVLFVGYLGLLLNVQAARRRPRQARISYPSRGAVGVPRYSSYMEPALRSARAVRNAAIGHDEMDYGYPRASALAIAGSTRR
jgi:hypothetical protein